MNVQSDRSEHRDGPGHVHTQYSSSIVGQLHVLAMATL